MFAWFKSRSLCIQGKANETEQAAVIPEPERKRCKVFPVRNQNVFNPAVEP